jgi:hypothetical protein
MHDLFFCEIEGHFETGGWHADIGPGTVELRSANESFFRYSPLDDKIGLGLIVTEGTVGEIKVASEDIKKLLHIFVLYMLPFSLLPLIHHLQNKYVLNTTSRSNISSNGSDLISFSSASDYEVRRFGFKR